MAALELLFRHFTQITNYTQLQEQYAVEGALFGRQTCSFKTLTACQRQTIA
jgi:hypothetical protein